MMSLLKVDGKFQHFPQPLPIGFSNPQQKSHVFCLSFHGVNSSISNREWPSFRHGSLLGTEHRPPLHRLRSTNLPDAPPFRDFCGAAEAIYRSG